MTLTFKDRKDRTSIPITPIEKAVFAAWLKKEPAAMRAWVETSGFTAEEGRVSLVPDSKGRLADVLVGVKSQGDLWGLAGLPERLPPGNYWLDARMESRADATHAAIGWALACYGFDRYKKPRAKPWPTLVWPDNCDKGLVARTANAAFLARDLINTPSADMGPAELADAAAKVARKHRAKITVTVGDRLLKTGYPTVHAVGRASAREPRLIDVTWGNPKAPKVTLVGKGVCFDSGGLDLKPSSGMLRMKKDMAGGALMLALADMIMDAKLPIRLRVLVPAVENSVSGNAMRPLDVIRTRKGITVEIGNTDAEGRLILCDALAAADEDKPALIIDAATLTGAARVAVGAELVALFANDDRLAGELLRHGSAEGDPMWRMPLWKGYRAMIDSKVADVNNVSDGPQAGAITAALYLNEFVSAATPWAHLDLYAWNDRARPGRPQGGEAQAIRAVYAMIAERFGTAAVQPRRR
ncbi:MAG TPA: leucyl aminopeptidase family protein [Alphaproteobacteria bacterium]